jgi:hypothetical protein
MIEALENNKIDIYISGSKDAEYINKLHNFSKLNKNDKIFRSSTEALEKLKR